MHASRRWSARTISLIIIAVVLVLGLCLTYARAGDFTSQMARMDLSGMTEEEVSLLETQVRGHTLGFLALLIPLCAVVLAFITREVVSALFIGLFYGHLMLGAVGSAYQPSDILGYLTDSIKGSLVSVLNTASDAENMAVVILCLVLGGLVAVINQTGAFQTLATGIVKRVKHPRHACLVAELLGVAVFFDDYANALIVGPVMRPVTDRLGVSREKLAFIVDSTAAPISSIALISSWVATEVAAIKIGLDVADVQESAYSIFVSGIPYNFYNILALIFIAVGILLGKEYGPMLSAEIRARKGEPLRRGSLWRDAVVVGERKADNKASAWIAILPIVVLCILAFIGFYVEGYATAVGEGLIDPAAPLTLGSALTAFGSADTVFIILLSAVAASILVLVLGMLTKSFDFIKGMGAWQQGASELLVTVIILILAWALSDVITQLGTVYFLVDLITGSMPYFLVPSVIFITCCVMSFGIGSYGCMAIVVPMVIPIAYGIVDTGVISDPWQFVVACTACVLSGSVFGDHCSPITDTTILSSMGAGCDNIDHVKTQLPYAITVAIIAVVSGTLLAGFGIAYWISYPIALLLIVCVFCLLGKNPDRLATKK